MKDNRKPLVTVLIPVYNRPEIIKTVKSILDQTYTNLEVLIVDNASTDSTVETIKKIVDKRIRLIINEKNMGQTYSLNRGLKEAKGKYIARIDSDDIALPRRIEKQVSFLEENPDYVLVGSWVRFIDDNDRLGMVVKMPTTDEGLRIMNTVSCGMYHPSAMYRTCIIRDNKIEYNPIIHMAADYDLWVKLMKYGKACNLAEPLIYYRRGNNNDSRHYEDLMWKESTAVRRKVIKELETSKNEKKQILKIINIESKEKKSLKESVWVHNFYMKYLNSHIDSASQDYYILKQHFLIKCYGSCFANNSARYAGFVRKIYVLAKALKNKIGG